MMPYDNSNSGMMYRNLDKQSDSHPDFTGFIDIDGEEFWLSAWVNESKDGSKLAAKGIEKYFSLKFKPKEARRPDPKPEPAQKQKDGAGSFDDMDDDIPF
jgi:single-stranded DNA-binding protein